MKCYNDVFDRRNNLIRHNVLRRDNKMVENLFRCPIELFEAYPIGRILNRMSCDMYVIDNTQWGEKVMILDPGVPVSLA